MYKFTNTNNSLCPKGRINKNLGYSPLWGWVITVFSCFIHVGFLKGFMKMKENHSPL